MTAAAPHNGNTDPSVPSDDAEENVVILVHGIRDYALWQSKIRATLKEAGFTAEPTNYGRFNIFQFLMPILFFRRWAIKQVWEQIRIVKKNHPSARLSIIAHSFGTYVVSYLVKRNFDLNADRIIFCGSVVSYRFRFQDYEGRFTGPILNDVGTRDIWPALAQSVTWGYGSTGSYGFRRPLVHDRWHNGAGHGFFLTREFCQKYWIPFLKDGTIVETPGDPERPGLGLRILEMLKIKYFLLAALAYVFLPYVASTSERVASAVRSHFTEEETNGIRPGQTWPWPKTGAACLAPTEKLQAASCGDQDGQYIVAGVLWRDGGHGLNVRSGPGLGEDAKIIDLLPPNMTNIATGTCKKVEDQGEWCPVRCTSKNVTIGYSAKKYLKLRSESLNKVTGLPQSWLLLVRNGPSFACTTVVSIPANATDLIVHTCQSIPTDTSSSDWCLVTYQQSSGWVPKENLQPEQNAPAQ